MVYIPWHIGDWVAETQLMSATERGVFVDLLIQYYTKGGPLTVDECRRIARAYAPAEQEAMQYVLQTCFTEEDGAYRRAKCDEEIAKVEGLSEKKKKAAATRWQKKSSKTAPEGREACTCNAPAEQMDSTCNANQNQNQNQNHISLSTERDRAPSRKRPSSACPYTADTVIPDDYREVATKSGVANPQACFEKFVNHALATDRRLVDWKAGFRTWCANELQYHPNQQTVRKPLSQLTAADYSDWLS